jgi:hypothetical protein
VDLEDLMRDQQMHLPPTYPHHGIVRLDLAIVRGTAGDLASATRALHHLLVDLIRDYGPDHHLIGRCLMELDQWQHRRWKQQRWDAAVAALTYRDLFCRLSSASPGHRYTVLLLDRIALWQGCSGDPARAVKLLARMRAEALRVSGPDDPLIAIIDENIAVWSRRPRRQSTPEFPVPLPFRTLTSVLPRDTHEPPPTTRWDSRGVVSARRDLAGPRKTRLQRRLGGQG